MAMAAAQLPERGTVRGQFIGGESLWMDPLVLEQFAQQSQRSNGIATLLDQYVQHFAFVIDSPPQLNPLAANFHGHFVQVPASSRLGSGSSKILCERPAELQRPTADSVVADINAALGQHLLNIAKAQGEAEIHPNGLADDVGREPVALERDRLHGHSPDWGQTLPQNGESLALACQHNLAGLRTVAFEGDGDVVATRHPQ
jgi:hypothetical protein